VPHGYQATLEELRTTAKAAGVYGFIYLLVNTLNDRKYVGITTVSVYKRWQGHQDSCKADEMIVTRAILKYGSDCFKVVIIGTASSKEQLDNYEKEAISFYKSKVDESGYNISNGGFSTGKHSDSTKMKISETKRSQNLKISQEHKDAIGAASRRSKSKEHIAKIAASNTGKRRSKEFCLKHKLLKQSRTGKPIIAISPLGVEHKFPCIREASRQLGLASRCLIGNILKGVYSQYKGWTFKYAERCE
jgi:group I intron endonuclease